MRQVVLNAIAWVSAVLCASFLLLLLTDMSWYIQMPGPEHTYILLADSHRLAFLIRNDYPNAPSPGTEVFRLHLLLFVLLTAPFPIWWFSRARADKRARLARGFDVEPGSGPQ
jgi:hypothetical protein